MTRSALFMVAAMLAVAPRLPAADIPATLTLDVALQLALEHNYAIRQARARYEQALGVVEENRSGRLPTLSANAGYTRTDEGRLESFGGQTFGSPDQWQAGIQASQTVYAGGAISSAIRGSEAAREAAIADFDASVRTALLSVQEQFYAVLLAREQIEVQEQAIQLLEEELANATARVEAGSGSPFDQLRAEVALANGQPPLIRARNALRLSVVELLRAAGLPAEDTAEANVVGSLSFEAMEPTIENVLASARENRPELRQLENNVDAAEYAVSGARATGRPVVGVFAGYGVQKSQFSDDFGDSVEGWQAGVQASWDIFDGNATGGRVAQARARLQQARLELDETSLAIDAEVRRAFLDYGEAREILIASQKGVTQAEESVRLARSRFDAGAATQLDVLQAQVALTETRTNEALALHDANVALARLRRAAALEPLPAGVNVTDSETE
ncbi:MAG: TolC family protein [Opitutaceae bacterium]